MSTTRTLRIATVVLLAAASATGCSSRACTMIGAESGVSVDLLGVDRSAPVQVEVCVATTCSTTKVDGPGSPVFVANAALDSEAARQVAVTVSRTDGTRLASTPAAAVTPRKVQPNGPDCAPTAFVGSVAVTGAPTTATTTP